MWASTQKTIANKRQGTWGKEHSRGEHLERIRILVLISINKLGILQERAGNIPVHSICGDGHNLLYVHGFCFLH
jgi:hypothetical protein